MNILMPNISCFLSYIYFSQNGISLKDFIVRRRTSAGSNNIWTRMFMKVKGSSKRLRFNLSPAPLSSAPHCFSFFKFYGQFDVIPFFTINLILISLVNCCRISSVYWYYLRSLIIQKYLIDRLIYLRFFYSQD